MNSEEVSSKVINIIDERRPAKDTPLGLDQDLSDVGIDSIALIEIIMDLEASLDVAFTDEMLTENTFASVASIVDAVIVLRSGLSAEGASHEA